MTSLIALLPCPIAIALAAVTMRQSRLLTRIAACLIVLQLAVAARCCWPVIISVRGSGVLIHGFGIDGAAAFFVLLTTVVVACALIHAVGFFARDLAGEHPPRQREVAQFYFFTPLFLLAMYCVVCADNLGYLWIGLEATTLLSAPLVYYHRSRTSLEATWKYVIICSVGIAFAFFGTAFLYAASQNPGAGFTDGSLSLRALAAHARLLPVGQLRLAFIFLLLGYGTKAGLFPLHSWLPDAHSEAPAPASAILSGALLNCALVAIWRISRLMVIAGQGSLVRATLLPMAGATVVAAALFLIKQRDIKRLLAYSTMENVGLMAGAIAIGSGTGFALQALNHSIVKVALFLLAGNLLQQFRTKRIQEFRGLLATQPLQGILLLLLGAAVAGTPPFGGFLSEWRILADAADGGHAALVGAICVALAIAFIALSMHLSGMLFGTSSRASDTDVTVRSRFSLLAVPGFLFAASLYLGLMLNSQIMMIAGRIGR